MRKVWFTLTVGLLFGACASAAEFPNPIQDDPFAALEAPETTVVSVEEVKSTPSPSSMSFTLDADPTPIPIPIPNIPVLPINNLALAIDVASYAWQVVQDNKPTATLNTASSSAMPAAAKQNWSLVVFRQPERIIHFQTSIKNHYGVEMINLQYEIDVLPGGTYNGVGMYIGYANVVATNVTVKWGYTLNMKAQVTAVYNAGSADNPVAAIALDVKYDYETMISARSETNSYLVRGDGLMQDKTSGKILLPGIYPL